MTSRESCPKGHPQQYEDARAVVVPTFAARASGRPMLPQETHTMTVDADELAIRFTYRPPQGTQPERYQEIRATAARFADLIVSTTPESREQSLALTKIEEAVFWANAAIARRE